MKCLLCYSNNLLERDHISANQISDLYGPDFREIILEELKGVSSISYVECLNCGLHFFYPPISASEKFYNLKNKSESYYLDEKQEYVFAKNFIDPSKNVLEIGCGKGAFAKHIKPKAYTGLEFSSDAIRLANQEGISVIRTDIQNFSKNCDQKFDVVCFFQVLEHIPNPHLFIESALSCLGNNGLMIVSVPNNDTYLSLMLGCALNMPPHHVTRWTVKAVSSIAKIFDLDFIDMDFEQLSDLHLNDFANTVALKLLEPALNGERVLDNSLKVKIKRRIAHYCIAPFISKAFEDHRIRPKGHSISAVFKKNLYQKNFWSKSMAGREG